MVQGGRMKIEESSIEHSEGKYYCEKEEVNLDNLIDGEIKWTEREGTSFPSELDFRIDFGIYYIIKKYLQIEGANPWEWEDLPKAGKKGYRIKRIKVLFKTPIKVDAEKYWHAVTLARYKKEYVYPRAIAGLYGEEIKDAMQIEFTKYVEELK